MMRKIREFPESLYEPWCKLYKQFAVDHQTSLVNLLQKSKHVAIQSALLEPRQQSEDLAFKLYQLTDTTPSESQLLSGYAYLKELESLYSSDPWRHRRAGKVPEVQIENQRYILWSPPYGHIAAAVPVAQRFTPDKLIGRNRTLDLHYCWISIPAETALDVDRTLALDALLTGDSVRIGIAPFAESKDMHWHADCTDRRGPRGEVPMRCTMANNDNDIWRRLETVLQTAHQSGVQILLFPELVLTQTLLERVVAWLESHNLADPVVQLVVAGTRHVDSDKKQGEFRNRCTVLDASGAVVWVQDKRQPFALEADQVRCLLPDFDAPAAFEPTELSQALTVRETAIGRILTPICLDYIHEDIWRELAGDLYLVPAMSSGLSRFRDRSRALGQLGAATLVCNACVDSDQEKRLVAYLPSRRPPDANQYGDSLFILDISFDLN